MSLPEYGITVAHSVYFLDKSGELHDETVTQPALSQTRNSLDSSHQNVADSRTDTWPPIAEVTGPPELDASTLEWQRGSFGLYTYYLKHMASIPLAIWVCITVLTGIVEKLPRE
jgi:hypothetical protein